MDARSFRDVLIAVGANLPSPAGPPLATVRAAIDAVAALGRSARASALYRTPCFPPGAGPDYVNAAIAVRSDADTEELLHNLHAIEARFGRVRSGRWTGRSLDLDLIAAGDLVRPDEAVLRRWIELAADRQQKEAPDRLILPHPRLQDRAFVLVPLADVAPEWRHPVLGRTVAEMLRALPPDAAAEIARIG